MSDLISMKTVIELIESKLSDGHLQLGEDIPLVDAAELMDNISAIPTAYDVDKVVAQLEQQISKNKDLYKNNKICLEESIDREVCYKTAIDFVKAGGV